MRVRTSFTREAYSRRKGSIFLFYGAAKPKKGKRATVPVLQQRIYVLHKLRIVPIGGFGDLFDHLTFGIDEVRLGVHEGPVVLMQLGFACGQEGRMVFLQEGAVSGGVFV